VTGSSVPRPAAARLLRRAAVASVVALVSLAAFARAGLAHAGSLAGSLEPAPVPLWLVVVSGGGVVGVSFLFTSLMTDHETIRSLNATRVGLASSSGRYVAAALRAAGVVGLAAVLVVAFVGPPDPLGNLAVLTVWVGWWAGYTMATYLVVDVWDLLNPWRTLAGLVPAAPRFDPASLGSRLSVVGLLVLVWVEVVTPVAEDPRTLGLVVLAYTVATVAGAVAFGDAWFRRADPVARVFRLYGRLAPIQRTGDGLTLSVPGTALARDPAPTSADGVAFVVALLWVTSYDGLVSTAPWNGVVRAAADAGVPALVVHFVTVFVGFALALGGYRLAARLARTTADTYVTADYVARWFAPALLPIAAGYHLAHFLGYFLGLAPALAAVALAPLSPPATVPTLTLPGWFGSLQLAFVVVGHVLAVWIAHARAFDLFAGRLQPIRSQYPFVVVMVAYTVSSLWIVSQPFASPLT
jgi:hypothetical protein